MLVTLTQAQSITSNPIPIYGSNFFGGGFAGISAVVFHIVNDAPGTASPIPGLLAPFAFNPVQNVLLALLFAAIGGSVAGLVGGTIFKHIRMKNGTYEKASEAAEEMAIESLSLECKYRTPSILTLIHIKKDALRQRIFLLHKK